MQRTTSGTRERVHAALQDEWLTDHELAARLDMERGTAGKARLRLWEQGLVEPDNWELALEMRRTSTIRWRAVPDPERHAEIAARASTRAKRRRKWSDLSVREQADFILQGLSSHEVYAAVMEAQASQRVKGRASARRNESLAAKRQRLARERKDAEREKSAVTDFLKIAAHLNDQVIVANGVRSFLMMDVARHLNGEATKIPPERYADVAANLREVMEDAGAALRAVEQAIGAGDAVCPTCGQETRPAAEEDRRLPERVELDEPIIDVDAIEL